MTHPVWKYLQGLNSFEGDLGVTLGAMTGGNTPASATYPTANLALYVPMYVNQAVLIKRLFVINGAAVSGNIDMGIYTQDGARIVSKGSTAQAGTNAIQFLDITDTILGPGRYYLAIAVDNTTATLFRGSATAVRLQGLGVARQTTAFTLPATATFAAVAAGFLPLMGAEVAEVR